MNIGAKLKQYRKAAKLTQQQGADLIGKSSKCAISTWEHGLYDPSFTVCLELLVAYRVPEAEALWKRLNDIPLKPSFAYCPFCGEKLRKTNVPNETNVSNEIY